VYTRDPRYFGVIQAGYRRVLQTMPDPDESGPSTVTPPETEAPSTPRSHSRHLSFGTLPFAGTTSRGTTPKAGGTPFSRSNNVYTTVPMDHSLASPTHKQDLSRKKRDRDTNGGREEGPAEGPAKRQRAS